MGKNVQVKKTNVNIKVNEQTTFASVSMLKIEPIGPLNLSKAQYKKLETAVERLDLSPQNKEMLTRILLSRISMPADGETVSLGNLKHIFSSATTYAETAQRINSYDSTKPWNTLTMADQIFLREILEDLAG